MARARIEGSAGTTGSRKEQKEQEDFAGTRRRHEPSSSTPFVARGSVLRSALFSAPALAPPPFEAFPERSRRGGVPPPWPRHTAHPPIGSELPHPSPFSPSATTIRLEIQAGEIRAGDSGGRFRREIFFQAPAGPFAAATPLPSPILRRSWPRAACQDGVRRAGSGEDGGGECVEGGVVV